MPDLPSGRYTLWWECLEITDTSVSSAVRHVSTGAALRIGPEAPDTAAVLPPGPRSPDGSVAILLAVAGVAGGLVVGVALHRRRYAAT